MTKSLLLNLLMLLGIFSKAHGQPAAAAPNNTASSPTMDIYLWFDTEDYLLPESDDAALRLAEMLSKESIRATFKVVGEKARILEQRGRSDVIHALRQHEIGYHSNWHSVHPTPAQYLSGLGWQEGVEEFVRREEAGAKDLERIFGQYPSCYGQPGSSWGPQSFGALQQMKIPVYLDAGNHLNLNDQPLWYGGILTIFHLKHTLRAELGGKKDLQEVKKAFLAAREQVLAQGGGAVHIYYHPCEWVHEAFWDGVNFSDGANPPREAWKLPPQKTPQQTEVAFDTFYAYLKWMKQQKNVRFLTARDALALYADSARTHRFTVQEIEQIARRVTDSITFQIRDQYSLSAAEIFTLLNSRIAMYAPQEKTNQGFTLAGTIFGPGEKGPIQESPQEVTWSQLQRTAIDIAGYLQKHGCIPSTVWLGSMGVSPETYLATIARLVPSLSKESPPQLIPTRAARLSTTQYIARDSEQLWGWLFPKGWHAPALMELAKLQAWTLKPAIRSMK